MTSRPTGESELLRGGGYGWVTDAEEKRAALAAFTKVYADDGRILVSPTIHSTPSS
jgi:hypothetical protein